MRRKEERGGGEEKGGRSGNEEVEKEREIHSSRGERLRSR